MATSTQYQLARDAAGRVLSRDVNAGMIAAAQALPPVAGTAIDWYGNCLGAPAFWRDPMAAGFQAASLCRPQSAATVRNCH
jgi:hypothetical protein